MFGLYLQLELEVSWPELPCPVLTWQPAVILLFWNWPLCFDELRPKMDTNRLKQTHQLSFYCFEMFPGVYLSQLTTLLWLTSLVWPVPKILQLTNNLSKLGLSQAGLDWLELRKKWPKSKVPQNKIAQWSKVAWVWIDIHTLFKPSYCNGLDYFTFYIIWSGVEHYILWLER